MNKRKIIKIDEDKCTGCGQCIPNCREGAIQIIDGKARLVNDIFCDGLGACLGHCPEGAITIEERQAEPFDERKAKEHIVKHHAHSGGCPGSAAHDFRNAKSTATISSVKSSGVSALGQWPVQITLVNEKAPYFKGADILVAADCVPFAYAGFHDDLLKGKILLVGCPKLDDIEAYREKISNIVKDNDIRSVTYAHMEVPCCSGLIVVIEDAIANSGKNIPFKDTVISIRGEKIK